MVHVSLTSNFVQRFDLCRIIHANVCYTRRNADKMTEKMLRAKLNRPQIQLMPERSRQKPTALKDSNEHQRKFPNLYKKNVAHEALARQKYHRKDDKKHRGQAPSPAPSQHFKKRPRDRSGHSTELFSPALIIFPANHFIILIKIASDD